MKEVRVSGLIKGGSADIGYDGDDFIRNRITAVAKFKTALGEHQASMRFPLQMVDTLSEEEVNNIMIGRLNRFIYTELFGRAFNMVKRLRNRPMRKGYWEAVLASAGKRKARTLEEFLKEL